MAQRSMFFDAVSGDRSYDAASYAALVRALVQHDGVVYGYGGNLAVAAAEPVSMNVTVATGAAFVQGRMFEVHTAGETLAIGAADPTNPRIDRVVVKLDNSSAVRSVSLAVKAGTPAASPTPPTLQRDGTVWELSLAQIYVAAGATSISAGNITDERTSDSVCGYASGMVLGSNANGSYVRFANGLQVCWGTISIAGTGWLSSGGKYYSPGTAQTFPMPFVSTPRVVTGVRDPYIGIRGAWHTSNIITTSAVTIYVAALATTDSALSVDWIAIGLWR